MPPKNHKEYQYNFNTIEPRWNKKWADKNIYKTDETKENKEYILTMFPYPSGSGLHMGHTRIYTAGDVYARLRRMQGYSVLFPIGWDSFGLPTEQYAIKTGMSPKIVTTKNTNNFKDQLIALGCSFDWEREINTSDPSYYKWTQWLFLQFFKKGDIEKREEGVNWCPKCVTVLANEDLENGKCERCATEIEQKKMSVWVFNITKYADSLLEGLKDLVKWPEFVKNIQKEWIGKSEGHMIQFEVDTVNKKVEVFTTRADTLMGVTYIVLAPEHPIIASLLEIIDNRDIVEEYCEKHKNMNPLDRISDKETSGVILKGVKAKHPLTDLPLTVCVSSYVIYEYGTGAIMGVPAHDERDHKFATKFKLPIIKVIKPDGEDIGPFYEGKGTLINSWDFNSFDSDYAKEIITQKLGSKAVTQYKLRDWAFSRQRYWGEPIPIVDCNGKKIAVDEKDLPIELPDITDYKIDAEGKSPLNKASDWKNIKKCVREVDTMPSWAGSSWYYLRYIDPNNNKEFISKEKEKKWMPVNTYIGGAEHIARHLIYARYWQHLMYDLGLVSHKEPFERLELTGVVFGSDGRKMSKRYGNVVTPDELIEANGADAVRLYEMFMAPFFKSVKLVKGNIAGPKRLLERIYKMSQDVKDVDMPKDLEVAMNFTIKKVTEDIEKFNFNTAVSQIMIFTNELESQKKIPIKAYEALLLLLAPFCPFLTDELWESLGHKKSIHTSKWPTYNKRKIEKDQITIAIQVNGKHRGNISIQKNTKEDDVIKSAKKLESVKRHLVGQDIEKELYVEGKIVAFVLKK